MTSCREEEVIVQTAIALHISLPLVSALTGLGGSRGLDKTVLSALVCFDMHMFDS